jgi:iduronate 2-sulfatase
MMNKLLISKITLFLLVLSLGFVEKSNTQTEKADAKNPNILLIISDDLNTRIGPYMELDKHTPHLDRLANEGVRFTRTYCQFPLCGPSRASLMSGLYCETNGVKGNSHVLGSFRAVNPALSNHPSLAGFFREQGYFTARVSKIYHMGVPGGIERGEPGGDDPDSWDFASNIMGPETLSQGKLELLSPGNLHYGSNFSRMILPNELDVTQTDYIAASQAIAILENRVGEIAENAKNQKKLKPDSPFFLAVGFVRPHVPLIAPENCFEPYDEEEVQLPPVVVNDNVPTQALRRQNANTQKMNELQKRQTISAYMASVRFMDQQVGRLLDALDRLKIREETIVIFISDHGYNLGEHDCWSKVSLWEGSVRVPMIISDPKNKTNNGTSNKSITELIDLYPTLAELSGLSKKQPEILQGNSLAGFINGKNQELGESVAYTITGGKGATIRTDRWRYTRWGEEIEKGNEELYDHQNDSEEHVNLADDSQKQKVLNEMRKKFELAREKAQTNIVPK